MEGIGSYLFRILCCTVVTALCLSLFPEGRMKGILRTFSGIFLTITILRPGMTLELPDPEDRLAEYRQQGQAAATVGEDYARRQRHGFIKDALEAYILDKAASLGCDLSVRVELDGDGYPDRALLSGTVTEGVRAELEDFLWEELGIAKEDQQWNGQGMLPSSEAG